MTSMSVENGETFSSWTYYNVRSGLKCVIEVKNHELIKTINDRNSTWPARSVILLRGNDDADNLDLYVYMDHQIGARYSRGKRVRHNKKRGGSLIYIYMFDVDLTHHVVWRTLLYVDNDSDHDGIALDRPCDDENEEKTSNLKSSFLKKSLLVSSYLSGTCLHTDAHKQYFRFASRCCCGGGVCTFFALRVQSTRRYHSASFKVWSPLPHSTSVVQRGQKHELHVYRAFCGGDDSSRRVKVCWAYQISNLMKGFKFEARDLWYYGTQLYRPSYQFMYILAST